MQECGFDNYAVVSGMSLNHCRMQVCWFYVFPYKLGIKRQRASFLISILLSEFGLSLISRSLIVRDTQMSSAPTARFVPRVRFDIYISSLYVLASWLVTRLRYGFQLSVV